MSAGLRARSSHSPMSISSPAAGAFRPIEPTPFERRWSGWIACATRVSAAPLPILAQLETLATQVEGDARASSGRDASRLRALAGALRARGQRLR